MTHHDDYDDGDLPDFCQRCVADHGCGRVESITTPYLMHWDGGTAVRAYYECGCGHAWRCMWSAARWLDAA
jgi:hypothetical protein